MIVLQKWQKKEQVKAKADGELPQTWKEYVAEQKVSRGNLFPAHVQCNRYMRISQYPGAYKAGMSIKEGYKNATAWHKNGGNPPLTSKLSIPLRLPNQIGTAAGRAVNKLEKYNAIDDWSVNAVAEDWSTDDFIGMTDTLIRLRKEIAISISKLNRVKEGTYDLH